MSDYLTGAPYLSDECVTALLHVPKGRSARQIGGRLGLGGMGLAPGCWNMRTRKEYVVVCLKYSLRGVRGHPGVGERLGQQGNYLGEKVIQVTTWEDPHSMRVG